jgi:uncharacterized protein (DUF924 family)
MTTTSEEVLAFWFGEPASDREAAMAKVRRWFRGGAELDDEVVGRFGAAVEAALAGELDAWAATPRGRLALIILLDQLTRNMFRGDARTYEGDAKAQALALEGFARGDDRALAFVERMFMAMPLLHSEDPAHHALLAEVTPENVMSPPPEYEQMAAMHLEQIDKYRDIIARFGRFPHRNAILGRATTPEEAAWLERAMEHLPPKRGS